MSEQKVPRSVEQRIVIKFLVGENVPSAEIHHRLPVIFEPPCIYIYARARARAHTHTPHRNLLSVKYKLPKLCDNRILFDLYVYTCL